MGAISIPLSQIEPRLPTLNAGDDAREDAPWRADTMRANLDEEVEDLVALLLEHASHPGLLAQHLARAVAEASMGTRHLWEDLGLADRAQLNALMQEHFTALKALNAHNMRWKKFLYRMLCERAEVLICKSPHCDTCEDKPQCFE